MKKVFLSMYNPVAMAYAVAIKLSTGRASVSALLLNTFFLAAVVTWLQIAVIKIFDLKFEQVTSDTIQINYWITTIACIIFHLLVVNRFLKKNKAALINNLERLTTSKFLHVVLFIAIILLTLAIMGVYIFSVIAMYYALGKEIGGT